MHPVVQTVTMMVGVSGSGKTTHVQRHLSDCAHISLDINKKTVTQDMRYGLIMRYEDEDPLRLAQHLPADIPRNPAGKQYESALEKSQNSNNRKAEYVLIADALRAGKDVVIDDTNLTRVIRWPYILLARRHHAAIRAISFFNIQQACRQNVLRAKCDIVPDFVIRQQCSAIEWPNRTEGFADVAEIY